MYSPSYFSFFFKFNTLIKSGLGDEVGPNGKKDTFSTHWSMVISLELHIALFTKEPHLRKTKGKGHRIGKVTKQTNKQVIDLF